MYCPRCGTELKIYGECGKGYKWIYRQYPCPKCNLVWDWASNLEDYWKVEECRAWSLIGEDILKEGQQN